MGVFYVQKKPLGKRYYNPVYHNVNGRSTMTNTVAVQKVGFFDALNNVFQAIFRATTVVDKTVQLAEREIDNLEEYQMIRLDRVRGERQQLLAELKVK